MHKDSASSPRRKWHDSAHASLCLMGSYLRLIGFFRPLEEVVKIHQKVLKFTPVQKLEMQGYEGSEVVGRSIWSSATAS